MMGEYTLTDEQKAKLTTKEKAERDLLPDELSIKDIGELMLKDNRERYSFYTDLIEACKAEVVEFTGDKIDSWQVDYDDWCSKYDLQEYPDKQYKDLNLSEQEARNKRYQEAYWEAAEKDYYEVGSPPNCLIHRNNLKAFLQSKEYWPVKNCLLANWWLKTEEEANNALKQQIKNKEELSSLDFEKLTIEQQAKQKTLPNTLSLKDIVGLWTPDKKGQESIRKAILEDYEKGVLIAENSDKAKADNSLKIHRDNFQIRDGYCS